MRRKVTRKHQDSESSDEFPKYHDTLISAINDRKVLKFSYEGLVRSVEPQTYGMGYTGTYLLRAYQKGGASRSGRSNMAKLFDLARISKLQKTGGHFKEALPSHNPEDRAMKLIFVTLPKRSTSPP
jgi:hypothetical protein